MQHAVSATSGERLKAIGSVVRNILFLKFYHLEDVLARMIHGARGRQVPALCMFAWCMSIGCGFSMAADNGGHYLYSWRRCGRCISTTWAIA